MSLLSLEEFRTILGYNPWHFWGLSGKKAPVKSACNDVIQEYAWQNSDAAGRREIAAAIVVAEDKIARHLGYFPAPKYVERTYRWPDFYNRNFRRAWSEEPDGRRVSLDVGYGYIQKIGAESKTVLGTIPVAVRDANKDCILDSFSCTFTTNEDPELLSLEFVDADLPSGEPYDRRVRPLVVTKAGNRVTFSGRTWTIVRPVLYDGQRAEGLDADDQEIYAKLLKVVKTEYVSGPTLQDGAAILRWESRPCHGCWFCQEYAAPNEPGVEYYAVGRSGIRDARLGRLTPDLALWNSQTQQWQCADTCKCGQIEPDKVTLRFLSGYPLQNGRMSDKFKTAVARLAMAELARDVCACDGSNRELSRWQFDRALNTQDHDTFQLSAADLDSPFGTSNGALFAWKQVKYERLQKSTVV